MVTSAANSQNKEVCYSQTESLHENYQNIWINKSTIPEWYNYGHRPTWLTVQRVPPIHQYLSSILILHIQCLELLGMLHLKRYPL